jgi:predicted RNase H-like HicB family nuclease
MKHFEHTYSLVVEQLADGYFAYFPALIGCQTWGDTFEVAVKHAEEALAVYLDTLIAHRDTIPTEHRDERVSLAVTAMTPIIA